MESLIRFLKIDATIQILLLIITAGTILVFWFIGIPLIILGLWQLISALTVWLKLRDKTRRNYMIFSLIYIVLMFFSGFYIDAFLDKGVAFFVIFQFIIFPVMIAIWYLTLTNRTLKKLQEGKTIEFTKQELENVLDIEEVLSKNI